MRIVRGVLVTCASLGETRDHESFARLVAARTPHTVLALLETLTGEAPEPELSLASVDFGESVLDALRAQASATTVAASRALRFDPEDAIASCARRERRDAPAPRGVEVLRRPGSRHGLRAAHP